MMADDQYLPLSARVDQLFDTFHSRSEAEQSMDYVAESVSNALRERVVTADYIAELRAGTYDVRTVESDLLAAVARHFEVPADYLLRDGDAVVTRINQQLRLLSAARNAGVRHIELRGDDVDIVALTEHFLRIADQVPPEQPT